jgi:hypothetical protein
MSWWHFVQHWLAIHLGIENEASKYYAAWSGSLSDIGEVTLLGAIGGVYWHHQCHNPKCHRIARHPTADGTFKLCARCHPDIPDHPTLEHIHALHHAARKSTD